MGTTCKQRQPLALIGADKWRSDRGRSDGLGWPIVIETELCFYRSYGRVVYFKKTLCTEETLNHGSLPAWSLHHSRSTLAGVSSYVILKLSICLSHACAQGCTCTHMHTGDVYIVQPMVSHYSTDLQVAITHRDMLPCTNKDRKEEYCKIVNMEVNNAGFKILQKSALQMFYYEGNVLDTFVRPQEYTQCVLISNTECRRDFCLCLQLQQNKKNL